MKTSTDGAAARSTSAGTARPAAPSVPAAAPVAVVAPASSRLRRSAHAATLLAFFVPALALALYATPHAADLLQFDRAGLARGELWRLVTGHFVHFDFSHLVWDALAFAILASLVRTLSWTRWLVLLVGSSVVISLGVLVLPPHFEFYRGLSGLDSALFAAALTQRWHEARSIRDRAGKIAYATIACAFLAKCTYEAIAHAPVFDTATIYTPAPISHLIGALCGALVVSSIIAPAALALPLSALRGDIRHVRARRFHHRHHGPGWLLPH